MTGPEAKVFAKIKNALHPCPISLKRVENSMDTGTPDVYFTAVSNEGWIELKQIKSFPKRESTPIKIPFRPGQYAWLMSRYHMNPSTSGYLLIQIEDVLFLFKNEQIQEVYTREELLNKCCFMSNNRWSAIATPLFKALNK